MQFGLSVVLLGVLALGGWVHAGPSDWLMSPIKRDRPRKLNQHDDDDVSFPISSFNPSVGVISVPNVCDKNNCSLIPNAKCISDRCGCEARFFEWNQQDKTLQDYSRMCHVSNTVANVQRFVEKAQLNDKTKDLNTASDPHVLIDLFRSFNSLAVESMLDNARYNSHVVKTNPTDTNLAKLRRVLKIIQSLQRCARRRLTDKDLAEEASPRQSRI
ncbi:hypothetical protein RvY_16545 [Ramazzottius varieornatus]|uniref:Uncharacterized protein n=1 Tax=Ramazzottius varieornatus TaxID=947166 RepID=A0A1D1W6D0_RAMVA|nr:hypothetical protein RvY_16545 [Ramazzottius varieornatus]